MRVPCHRLFTIAMPTPRELAVMYNKRNTSFNGFERLASYSSNVLENMRLLTSSLRGSTTGGSRSRTASEASLALAEQTRYGFAFSQDETSGVAQTELIRNVDSTREKPTGR
ncbi:hypothetical protein CRE_19924 [Caenorhabditis remanei]|uniref:Uncharacterized protein n=1 Tax=Caenorhabditis remanei TaxID=31234 RepID=E3N307_CAERE|nr:hypothetical protein CRE_19924 [Caenorhabditis remanei]